jgi:hypothetical protein
MWKASWPSRSAFCRAPPDLWVQAPPERRQRFQQLFFPEEMVFDGQRFVGTVAIAPAFSYLREIRPAGDGVVDLTGIAARWLSPQASAACPHHGQGRQTERSEGWWTRLAGAGTAPTNGSGASSCFEGPPEPILADSPAVERVLAPARR